MIFLSRQNHDDSNPHEIRPIAFNMHSLLNKKHYNIWENRKIFSTDMISNKIQWD